MKIDDSVFCKENARDALRALSEMLDALPPSLQLAHFESATRIRQLLNRGKEEWPTYAVHLLRQGGANNDLE